MHDGLLGQFNELKARVAANEDVYKPIAVQGAEVIKDYPITVRDLYSKIESVKERTIVSTEAFKAIHRRMDVNDDQRKGLEGSVKLLRDELKEHMEDEETSMKESKDTVLKIGMFLAAYLISFAVYMYDVTSTNNANIKVITHDINFIKSFVQKVKEPTNGQH